MADTVIETYNEAGGWKNRPQGNERATSTHETKEEAVKYGRNLAKERKGDHIIKNIKNLDGTISERHSYSE